MFGALFMCAYHDRQQLFSINVFIICIIRFTIYMERFVEVANCLKNLNDLR